MPFANFGNVQFTSASYSASGGANGGTDGAQLSAGGELTDIGAWYLGREVKGVAPSSTAGSSATEIQVGLRGWLAIVFAAVLVL